MLSLPKTHHKVQFIQNIIDTHQMRIVMPLIPISDRSIVSITSGIAHINCRLKLDKDKRTFKKVQIFTNEKRFLITGEIYQYYNAEKDEELHKKYKSPELKGKNMIDFINIFDLDPKDFDLTNPVIFNAKRRGIFTKTPIIFVYDCIDYYVTQ